MQEIVDANPALTATGHLVPPSPLRVVAKRILLTGHPFKIHKRSAVIRYMFFDPLDVEYFKPVQLTTKMGCVGHIRESLGTHGYMKCLFGQQVTQQDTVCLSLYKRVFPKWTTRLWVDRLESEDVSHSKMET
jgi:pre-rRNA-processing protein TSR1